jgi:predicted HTH transcriptional regulator
MLPFGMTLDDLKAGVSRIRNRVIVRVLRELGLVEEWGTGRRAVSSSSSARRKRASIGSQSRRNAFLQFLGRDERRGRSGLGA